MSSDGDSFLLFAGSYTDFDILAHLPHNDSLGDGVYCLNFENGDIKLLSKIPCLNPAVMHFDKRDANTLYVLTEGIKENGVIHTIRVKPHFLDNNNVNSIDLIAKFNKNEDIMTEGMSLCYFGMNSKHGIAINYWQGSVDVFELTNNKNTNEFGINIEKGILQHIEHNSIATKIENISNRRQVIHREDHWVNRQCGSHAHSAHFWKNWVFIPDLGDNSVYQYGYYPNGKNGDSNIILDYEGQIQLNEGCGPRHMVFHPTLPVAYVSNELNSSITVLSLNENDLDCKDEEDTMVSEEKAGSNSKYKSYKLRMKPIQYVSTIDENGESSQIDAKNYVAEICLSPNGKDIYVSNRGHDSIAHFNININNGKVTLNDFIPTYGQCPRHFAMAPNGKYLLVANQDTNSISVFKRDLNNGDLTFKSQFTHKSFNAPNFLLFYPNSNEFLLENSLNTIDNNENDSDKDHCIWGKNAQINENECIVVNKVPDSNCRLL